MEKITPSNLVAKWDSIKSLVNAATRDTYNAGIPEVLTIYNDDADAKKAIDTFIADVNRQLAETKSAKPATKRKYVRGKGKLRRKKQQPKPESKKTTKKSTAKKETKKATTKKEDKTKLAEPPNWLKTLRSFKNAAGKERTVTGIRKMVMDIQDRFDAKRGLKTPHITLIREIQDKLLPYANRHTDRKVQLPQWTDLVEQCKKAIATVSVSSKVSKEDIKTATLAGTHKSRKKRETRKATRKKKAARKASRKPKK